MRCESSEGSCSFLHAVEGHRFAIRAGMVTYCMNDNVEYHFKFVHHNITADDMNECKLEYVKFGKVG